MKTIILILLIASGISAKNSDSLAAAAVVLRYENALTEFQTKNQVFTQKAPLLRSLLSEIFIGKGLSSRIYYVNSLSNCEDAQELVFPSPVSKVVATKGYAEDSHTYIIEREITDPEGSFTLTYQYTLVSLMGTWYIQDISVPSSAARVPTIKKDTVEDTVSEEIA